MASYTTASLGSLDGSVLPSPGELPSGTGIDLVATTGLANMAAIATSLENFSYRAVLKDSDAIIYNAGNGMLVSYILSWEMQKLFSQMSLRLNSSGNLRFVHRNSAQLLDLASALASVGIPAPSGLVDAYSTLAERQAVNAALNGANIPLVVWKA